MTRRKIVTAASVRTWPGWRRLRPSDSRRGIWQLRSGISSAAAA